MEVEGEVDIVRSGVLADSGSRIGGWWFSVTDECSFVSVGEGVS